MKRHTTIALLLLAGLAACIPPHRFVHPPRIGHPRPPRPRIGAPRPPAPRPPGAIHVHVPGCGHGPVEGVLPPPVPALPDPGDLPKPPIPLPPPPPLPWD